MTGILRLITVGVVLCSVIGSASGEAHEEWVELLMDRSGLDKQFEQLPQIAVAGVEQARIQRGSISESRSSVVRMAILEAFSPVKLRPIVADHISKQLNPSDASIVLDWLGTPIGRKITKLEENASTPEAYAQMQIIGPELMSDEKQIAKIRELDKAIGITDSSVQMALDTQLAVLTALGTESAKQISIDSLAQKLESKRMAIERAILPQVQLSLLYTYKDLSKAEISEYIEFAHLDAAIKYHEVTIDALSHAFQMAVKDMVTILQKEKTGQPSK